jgi:hypothetical protein
MSAAKTPRTRSKNLMNEKRMNEKRMNEKLMNLGLLPNAQPNGMLHTTDTPPSFRNYCKLPVERRASPGTAGWVSR